MVAKLLGDATYFPIEFRRWLKDYIENSEIKISSSQIIGGGGGGGSASPTLLPAGIILPFATTFVSKDVLPCNGAAVARADYPDLFAAIGAAWGSGDGSTTFNVPDLRDRALYGLGSIVSLAGTDGRALGSRGGPSHHHTASGNTNSNGGHSHGGSVGGVGDHSHSLGNPLTGTVQNVINAADAAGVTGASTLSSTGSAGAHNHGLSINSVGDHSHSYSGSTSGGFDNDKPSFAGVQYAITTGRTGS